YYELVLVESSLNKSENLDLFTIQQLKMLHLLCSYLFALNFLFSMVYLLLEDDEKTSAKMKFSIRKSAIAEKNVDEALP
ncbi:MAG: hypothetical protein MHPSP_002180, partial [Paramarteilia canceri]